ncbi:hypothetical protein RJ640_010045, partial [Escallonia rubra]
MEHPLTKCTRMFFLLGMVMIELQSYGSLGCWEDERAGLMKLKDAFDGPTGYSALSSWGGGEERDCCKWERVVCDNATKRISRLSLREARFSRNGPSLDASLFLPFQDLQNVSLADNALTGFRGVLNVSKLEVLDLSGNSLTEIPSLDALQSLRSLDLGNNIYSNNSHSFKELTNLTNLEMLHLDGYGLMEIPASIWALTSLKGLYLSNNILNGLLPLRDISSLLCTKPALQVLLNSSLNADTGFEGVLNLRKLEVLDLSWNSFTEIPSLDAMQSL